MTDAPIELRPQCRGCPWRDMDTMRAEYAAVVARAEQDGSGFVCHERCGPCDGPYHAQRVDACRVR